MAGEDKGVIKSILNGDREAFGDLVDRYSGLVHGVILNRVRRTDEVEDLVQDVFCKAFEELATLRDPERFAPWLARIAQNRAQQWLRQRQTHMSYVPAIEEHLSSYAPDERPDRLLETSESDGILWEALDQLRPEFRQVILLYHFENCRQHDIARFLNVSLPTVKWRLMRARRVLQLEIDEAVAGAGGEQRRTSRQRTREKILAALPLLALAPRPQQTFLEGARGLLGGRSLKLAYAGSLCVLGSLMYQSHVDQVEAAQSSPTVQHGKIVVRLQPLPAQGLTATEAARGALLGSPLQTDDEGLLLFPPCAAGKVRRR